ncbi:MAG: porphobilinogen synthase [Oscillospiraceae bacterium]|jgi:porphobilinogen synthase|nr:porphobilinogen synthase [Oscillospiraceae bacterium]
MDLVNRPRRLRRTDAIRRLNRETRLSAEALIYPVFVDETLSGVRPIPSLPGQNHYGLDSVCRAVEECLEHGVKHCILFGLPAEKDACGSSAWAEHGVIQETVRTVKARFPDFTVITDVCMCEYTDHGHCGILHGHEVDNDETLAHLAKIAVSHAAAGADMVAPSDMMDGHVAALRKALDGNGFQHISIMAYSAKYASAFYGPFREAAGSAPSFGDRKSYQMDPHNRKEALRECRLDMEEGADILMVKPALSYLDVIRECSDAFDLPMCAYSVSGEYAMIKAAAAAGLVDERRIMCESALSIFRAGADMLITYYAKEIADAIQAGEIG